MSRDGSRLLLGAYDGNHLYHVEVSKLGEEDSVYEIINYQGSMYLSSDGQRGVGLAGGPYEQKNVTFYSEDSAVPIWTAPVPCFDQRWYSPVFTPPKKGNFAAIGGCEYQNRSLFLFKYQEREPLFIYYSRLDFRDIAFSEDETHLASIAHYYPGGDTYLLLFDTEGSPLIPNVLWTPILLGISSAIVVSILFIVAKKLERKKEETPISDQKQ
jgi:hypothetical protein